MAVGSEGVAMIVSLNLGYLETFPIHLKSNGYDVNIALLSVIGGVAWLYGLDYRFLHY